MRLTRRRASILALCGVVVMLVAAYTAFAGEDPGRTAQEPQFLSGVASATASPVFNGHCDFLWDDGFRFAAVNVLAANQPGCACFAGERCEKEYPCPPDPDLARDGYVGYDPEHPGAAYTHFTVKVDTSQIPGGPYTPHVVAGSGIEGWEYSEPILTIRAYPTKKSVYFGMANPPPNTPLCGWHDMDAIMEIWIDFDPVFEPADGMWMSTNSFQFELYYKEVEQRFGLYVMGKGGTHGFFKAFIPDSLLQELGVPIENFQLYRDGVVGQAAAALEGATFSLEQQQGGWLFSYVNYVHPSMPDPPCWQPPAVMVLTGKQLGVGQTAKIPFVLYELPDPLWGGDMVVDLVSSSGAPIATFSPSDFKFNGNLQNTAADIGAQDGKLHLHFEDDGSHSQLITLGGRQVYEARIGTLTLHGASEGVGNLFVKPDIMVKPSGTDAYHENVNVIPGPLMVGSFSQVEFPFLSVGDVELTTAGSTGEVTISLCGKNLPDEGELIAWVWPTGKMQFDPDGYLFSTNWLTAPQTWSATSAYEKVEVLGGMWDNPSGSGRTEVWVRFSGGAKGGADPNVRPIISLPVQSFVDFGWAEINAGAERFDSAPQAFMAAPGTGIATIGGSTYGPMSLLERYRAMRPLSLTEESYDTMMRGQAVYPLQKETQYQPLGGFSDWLAKRAAQGNVFRTDAGVPWVRPMSGGGDGINFELGTLQIGAVAISANPTSIPADGSTTSTITATVKDDHGNNVPDGTQVAFRTTAGTVGSTTITKTTTNGVATATLTSSTTPGGAAVTATSGGKSATTTVLFTPAGVTVTEMKGGVVEGSGTVSGSDTVSGIGEVTINGTGSHVITTAKYNKNPGGSVTFNASGSYWDIFLAPTTGVNSLAVEFCPASPSTIIYYWDGSSWIRASNQSYSDGCITVIVTSSTSPTLSQLSGLALGSSTVTVGDINDDSYINVLDVRLCLQIATGAISGTTAQQTAADVDGDGDVDMDDAQLLARYIIGIEDKLGGD